MLFDPKLGRDNNFSQESLIRSGVDPRGAWNNMSQVFLRAGRLDRPLGFFLSGITTYLASQSPRGGIPTIGGLKQLLTYFGNRTADMILYKYIGTIRKLHPDTEKIILLNFLS